MARVYLAAPFYRDDVHRIAAAIMAGGHTVTSRWIAEVETDAGTTSVDAVTRDFEDIDGSDAVLILDDLERWSGRHVEVGYALARGLPVVVLGPASNVFYRTVCHAVETVEQALAELDGIG